MNEQNHYAMKCASALTARSIDQKLDQLDNDAAEHIRRLVAENEAKDALLHRAFTAVEAAALDESKDARQRRQQIATAIRQHLRQKGETG